MALAAEDSFRQTFRDAFRTLLLPIDPGRETEALDGAVAALEKLGIDHADQAAHIRINHAVWRAGGNCPASLAAAIDAALREGNGDIGARLAKRYFTLHELLRERHLYSFEQTCSFLSHLRLVLVLASQESMSAAQIAKLLEARDKRVGFGWRAVRDVLIKLGYRLVLDRAQVEMLFARDAQLEEILFADAGFLDAASIVGAAGGDLGFPGDLELLLMRLFPPTGPGRHGPYLQILHYVLTVAEFYDHASKVLYEFRPRGEVAKWIFNSYPIDLRARENPVLNNAKSVDVVDGGWARSKEDHLLASTALYEIIDGLEQLGFAARQELSAWLRRWLFRVVRLTRNLAQTVPDPPTAHETGLIVAAVIGGETRTFGVIEQRLADVLALTKHPESDGWRRRGIGDSVNASNVSRRKIGDAEFQNVSVPTVVAYESHAGRLTETYVDGHIETLRRVIPLRAEEWQQVAPREQWTLDVRFVAHHVQVAARELEIDGFRVLVTAQTFASFCSGAPAAEAFVALYREHMTRRLNDARTPESVRLRYNELVGRAE